MDQHSKAIRPGLVWTFGVLSLAMFTLYAAGLSHHWQSDFEVYRAGGTHLFGGDLYAPRIKGLGSALLFTYTPLSALVFWPFSLFSTPIGQLTWDLFNVGALTALIAVSSAAARRRNLQRGDWQLALIAVAPVGFLLWPIRDGFELGQVNVVLILMIVTDLTMTISFRKMRLQRGVLVGLAAAIKLTPLIFLPYLCVTRQWAAARNALISFLAATGAMLLLAPRESWSYFTQYVYEVRRVGPMSITNNQTLQAALTRTDLPIPHVVVDLLLVGLFCVGMALAAIAYRRSSAFLGVLVCAATGLLLSPISWQHHYAWCVPLLAWLVFGIDRPRHRFICFAVAAAAFVLPIGAQSARTNVADYLRQNADVIATLAFIGLIGALLWMRNRDRAAQVPTMTRRLGLERPRLNDPEHVLNDGACREDPDFRERSNSTEGQGSRASIVRRAGAKSD